MYTEKQWSRHCGWEFECTAASYKLVRNTESSLFNEAEEVPPNRA